MIPFFGASVYDDPAVYEKSSPIRFIKGVKTPTLVIVGERDAEAPATNRMNSGTPYARSAFRPNSPSFPAKATGSLSPKTRPAASPRSEDASLNHLGDEFVEDRLESFNERVELVEVDRQRWGDHRPLAELAAILAS